MTWDTKKEKLLCLMELNDALAPKLSDIAGPAFWRCFIVQDRTTGQVTAKMRWRYQEPTGRRWYEITPPVTSNVEEIVQHLRCGIEDIVTKATGLFAGRLSPEEAKDCIRCHYPPDDGGDPAKTIIWLEQQDLVEIKSVEPIEPTEGEAT